MLRLLFIGLLAGNLTQAAEAFRKFVLTPADVKTILNRTCVSFTASLVNANGEPATVDRDKEIILTSSAPSTEFYAFFTPGCVSQVKGASWLMNPGQTTFRFSVFENLSRMPGKERDLPHPITVTVSARGVQAAKRDLIVRSNDCGYACKESCIETRAQCTKECGGVSEKEKISLDNQPLRQCWKSCYGGEESCLSLCVKQDQKVAGGCTSGCAELCEEIFSTCFGRCYFHEESRNTSLGAKCVYDCHSFLDKCYQVTCRS